MKTPSLDELIESLSLAHVDAPYDPAKRREYYLKTRQLKGRAGGQAFDISSTRTKNSSSLPPVKKPKVNSKQAEFQAKIDALNARLDKLKKVLAELVKQAQARSGVEPADTKSSSDKPAKKLTAKQKADAAKRAKKSAEKNKNKPPTPSQQVKELETKIKAIQAKIKKMKAEIAAKKKPSKHKAGSVGASSLTIHK
jgi:DNA mismatch repair ATPase MutS